MWVVNLSALTTLLPEKKLELEAVWVMEMAWMFWKRNISISPAKIWTADVPGYIPVFLLSLLPRIDLR